MNVVSAVAVLPAASYAVTLAVWVSSVRLYSGIEREYASQYGSGRGEVWNPAGSSFQSERRVERIRAVSEREIVGYPHIQFHRLRIKNKVFDHRRILVGISGRGRFAVFPVYSGEEASSGGAY